MSSKSPKLGFLNRASNEEDQDHYDGLIRVQRDEYRPNRTGTRLHLSLARTRIARGGLGSGKSRCSTEHVNNLALRFPGSLHFVGRKDITSLKVTTQREFLEKVVTPETILTFNVNENTLYYKNGSIVLFRETKEPDKVKSLELTSYLLDEADENDNPEIWEKLDDRLRQKIRMDGQWVTPPYAGLIVLNPTHEEHWIYHLSKRTDIDLEDFQFSTYDNSDNLPPDYIPNLLKKLPPWDVQRLVYGNWGRTIKGKPVYHGFNEATHVRPIPLREDLPVYRGWDFGYGHPAVVWAQIDPISGRYMRLREFMGVKMHLKDVVTEVKRITQELCGIGHPVLDFGDPHGADQKDVGESSIEYLRIHHNIYITHKRERVKTGMEEIQEKILTDSPIDPNDKNSKSLPHFLIDPHCKISVAAYCGGYHRDELGEIVKDGYYDHLPDCDRYVITNNMNRQLVNRFKNKKRYQPRNSVTGY